MVDLMGIGSGIWDAIMPVAIVIGSLAGLFALTCLVLWIKKGRKFDRYALVMTETNKPIPSYFLEPAGWFGRDKSFFNLLDNGEKRIELKNGGFVSGVNTDHFTTLQWGRKTLNVLTCIVARKDQDIIVPFGEISRKKDYEFTKVKSIASKGEDLLGHIADADYRNTARQLILRSETEIKIQEIISTALKYGLIALLVIGAIVVIALLLNFTSQNVKLWVDAMRDLKNACPKDTAIVKPVVQALFLLLIPKRKNI